MSGVENDAFARFRGSVPLRQVVIKQTDEKTWKYFDYGDKSLPLLVCLPGASATAACFYKQIQSLSTKGMRVVSVQAPGYSKHEAWAHGFDRLLDELKVHEAHLYGVGLGGFLAQYYASVRPKRVLSLVLTNTFCSTEFFVQNNHRALFYSWMPAFLIRKQMLDNFPQGLLDADIADSVDFVAQEMENLSRDELASRMILNCTQAEIGKLDLPSDKITIMDSMDNVAVPGELRDALADRYQGARLAPLRSGGNFPFLAKPDEVNLYLTIHLRAVGALKMPVVSDDGNHKDDA